MAETGLHRFFRAVRRSVSAEAGLPAHAGALIIFCFLGMVLVTYHQAWWSDTFRVDQSELGIETWVYLYAAFGLFATPAAVLYLRAHDGAARLPARHILKIAVALQLVAAAAQPLTSNDLWSNMAYGRMMVLGLNPYLQGPEVLEADGGHYFSYVGQGWAKTPIVYGPIAAWQDQLSAWLGGDPVLASVVFKLTMVACTLIMIGVAWKLCRVRDDDADSKRNFLFLAWNPMLAWEVSAQHHNDGLMVLFLLGFVALARAERPLLAAFMLTLAFCTKSALLPVMGLYALYLLRRSWRTALAATFVFAAVTVLLFLPFWAGPQTLAAPLGAMSGSDPARNTRSLYTIIRVTLMLFHTDDQWLWLAFGWNTLATVPLVAAAVYPLRRTRTVADVELHSLRFFLVYLLISAMWTQPWYATWLLPLALLVKDGRWQRVVAVYSALLVIQYTLPIDPYTYAIVHGVPLAMLWPLVRPMATQARAVPSGAMAAG